MRPAPESVLFSGSLDMHYSRGEAAERQKGLKSMTSGLQFEDNLALVSFRKQG
jgi:hypothetical protein